VARLDEAEHDRRFAGPPRRILVKQEVRGWESFALVFESVGGQADLQDWHTGRVELHDDRGRDLGSVSDEIRKIVTQLQKQLSPSNSIQAVGQIQSMKNAFRDLSMGLLFAAVFVYLLMVVNYQNFGDPFVVILALPATFCGILTMLFVTGTTLNVLSLAQVTWDEIMRWSAKAGLRSSRASMTCRRSRRNNSPLASRSQRHGAAGTTAGLAPAEGLSACGRAV
jgi:hypothetical protein